MIVSFLPSLPRSSHKNMELLRKHLESHEHKVRPSSRFRPIYFHRQVVHPNRPKIIAIIRIFSQNITQFSVHCKLLLRLYLECISGNHGRSDSCKFVCIFGWKLILNRSLASFVVKDHY